MSANEIAKVSEQYHGRLAAILTPDQLACFEAYQRRVELAIARRETAPIPLTPDEQAVLDTIAADTQATALRTQLDILIGIAKPPQ